MLTVLWLRFKRIKDNMPIILGMTAMAFGLIAVFGSAFAGGYHPTVYVIDEEQTKSSKDFIIELKDNDIFNITTVSRQEAVERLENNKGIAAVVIEKGFLSGSDNDSKVRTLKVNESREYFSLIQLLQGKISKYNHKLKLSSQIKADLEKQGILYNNDIDLKVSEQLEKSLKNTAFNNNSSFLKSEEAENVVLKYQVIGFTIFFSMYTMIFGIGELVEEKRWLVYHRQLVSSMSNSQIIIGNLIYTFALGFIQVSAMIIAGQYLFGIDWGKNLGAIILVVAAFVFCVTSLGLFMSSFVKSMQQLGALSPIVLTSTAMLGGCMWPLDMIQNKALIMVANLTPQKWVVDTVNKMVNYNQPMDIIWVPIMVLVGMGCVYLVIGVKRMKVNI